MATRRRLARPASLAHIMLFVVTVLSALTTLRNDTQTYMSRDPSGFLGHRGIGTSVAVRDGVVTGLGSARQFC